MRIAILLVAALFSSALIAKLPPQTDEQKAKAAEAAAKAAWSDKVAAFQTCRAGDRVVENYRKTMKAEGKPAPTATATPPCSDPGPYVPPTPVEAKPLEASGAHSPPGVATAPPSTTAPAAALQPAK